MSEWYDNHIKEKKNRILKSGESFSESEIYCPYCAHEQQDIFEWDLTPNGEDIEEQCQSCERHFAYSCRYVYSTRKLK